MLSLQKDESGASRGEAGEGRISFMLAAPFNRECFTRKVFERMCSKMLISFLWSICAFSIAGASELDHNYDCQCGLETSSNPLHYSPWLVQLEFVKHRRLAGLRCAGTLVDPEYVVTAAHCIILLRHHRMLARLGDYDLSTRVDCVKGVCADTPLRVPAARVYVHPEYDGLEHDIAIIQLENKVPCTNFIRPICLPEVKLKNFAIFEAAGWGTDAATGAYSNVKKSLSLPSLTYTACRKVYRQYIIPQNAICAGGIKGIDTCKGDSGGPLTYRGNFVELHGVTSSGPVNCGSEGQPGIYTSIMDNMDFIKKVIGKRSKSIPGS